MSNVTADRRLWSDKNGELVEDGDPRAAVLFCGAGQELTKAQVKASGYEPLNSKEADPDPVDLDALRARADDLGIKYGDHWGGKGLNKAIAAAEEDEKPDPDAKEKSDAEGKGDSLLAKAGKAVKGAADKAMGKAEDK